MTLNKAKSLYFHQLAVLQESGIPILNAMTLMETQSPTRGLRSASKRIRDSVVHQRTLAEAFRQEKGIFSPLEVELIAAGEATGSIEITLRALADWLIFLEGSRRSFLSGLAYPVFLLHALVFLSQLPDLVVGRLSLVAFLGRSAEVLLPLYLLAWAFFVVVPKIRRGMPSGARVLDSLALMIPLARTAILKLCVARFALALKCTLDAGVSIGRGFQMAADACGNAALRARFMKGLRALKAGKCVTDSLKQCGVLSPTAIEFIRTGEESGRLDEMLGRLSDMYKQEAESSIRTASEWIPRLAYLLVALGIGYSVIRTYGGYMSSLGSVIDQMP